MLTSSCVLELFWQQWIFLLIYCFYCYLFSSFKLTASWGKRKKIKAIETNKILNQYTADSFGLVRVFEIRNTSPCIYQPELWVSPWEGYCTSSASAHTQSFNPLETDTLTIYNSTGLNTESSLAKINTWHVWFIFPHAESLKITGNVGFLRYHSRFWPKQLYDYAMVLGDFLFFC